jgi:hypothetical protein
LTLRSHRAGRRGNVARDNCSITRQYQRRKSIYRPNLRVGAAVSFAPQLRGCLRDEQFSERRQIRLKCNDLRLVLHQIQQV